MSEQNEELEVVTQDELEVLKQRADILGIAYHPSIGLQKLRAKVRQATEEREVPTPEEEVANELQTSGETEGEIRARKRREAAALVRVRVSCMNPNKKDYEGEFFSVGNGVVGTFTKYVPFNNEEGWHIPTIIYKDLKQRQCQIFINAKDNRGNAIRKAKLIKEFNVELLEPLTEEEMKELAHRQATAHSIDN